MQWPVMPFFQERHMNAIVVVPMQGHGIRFSSILHKPNSLVQRDCRFIGHVHLQVHALHTVVESVLKRGVYNLLAQASATIPR